MNDPLAPSAVLLCKLGSIIVHAEEGLSDSGHVVDIDTFYDLLGEADVQEWFEGMRSMALLPVKR